MNRYEFNEALQSALKDLPQEELQQSLSYFNEMIDDRIEEGMSEDEAIADIGNVDEIAGRLLAEELSIVDRVKDKVLPKRALSSWEIILIVLGFPLWGSLLVAAVALVLSIVVVILSMFVFAVAALISGVAILIFGPFSNANGLDGLLVTLGTGCIFVGLGLLCISLFTRLTKFVSARYIRFRKEG